MLTIKWEWTCDICGVKEIEETQRIALFPRVVETFCMPNHWSYIEGKMLCSEHHIDFTVKAKDVPVDQL